MAGGDMSRSFRHGFMTFCADTHRARRRLVRVQSRVRTQMKGKGRCFPKRRIGGGQRVNRGSLCARAGSSCTLDFGVIHLVGRCRINPRPLISTDYQQDRRVRRVTCRRVAPRCFDFCTRHHPPRRPKYYAIRAAIVALFSRRFVLCRRTVKRMVIR